MAKSWLAALLLVLGCAGDKAPTDPIDAPGDTDTDADADADTDSDTDADTADTGPTEPEPEDCPEPGAGMVVATVVATDAPIVATDSVNLILFPTYPAPPGFFFTEDGDRFGALPAAAIDTGVPAQYWNTVMVCLDRDADHLATCDGPGDHLVLLPDPMTVIGDQVISFDVDFGTDTTTVPVFSPPDPVLCP